MSVKGTKRSRWLVLWIAVAATAGVGVLLLYAGSNLLAVGKGFGPPAVLGQTPFALMAIGVIGIVAAAVGVARTNWHAPATPAGDKSGVTGSLGLRTNRLSDAAALGGFIVAIAALIAVILVEFVWPSLASTLLPGPCDQNPSVACFSAYPDYEQETGPGSGGYSTPVSRIGNEILTPILLSAWPLAFAAALVSGIALGTATRRRRLATFGIVLGSLAVAGMGVQYLAFLVVGGD